MTKTPNPRNAPTAAEIEAAAKLPRFAGWDPEDIAHDLHCEREEALEIEARALYECDGPDWNRISRERIEHLVACYIAGENPDEDERY